jgi:hypothetical protein
MRAVIGVILLAVSGAGAHEPALHVADLLQHPDTYLNRMLDVEIVEPLFGPTTPEALAKLEYGQVVVGTPSYSNLALVPAAFKLEDPNRYHHKFDRVIESPLRVHGELLEDKEISAAEHRPAYVLRVVSMEDVALGTPEVVDSLSVINADPGHWDRKLITYEGNYESRFEVSALDRSIWLSYGVKAQVIGKRPARDDGSRTTQRVRVTGILFTHGGFYGHLGQYKYELVASKIEYLD